MFVWTKLMNNTAVEMRIFMILIKYFILFCLIKLENCVSRKVLSYIKIQVDP